jgi:hypothetical protein
VRASGRGDDVKKQKIRRPKGSSLLMVSGVNGSVWDLTTAGEPVQLSGDGLTGTGTGPRRAQFAENALSDGRVRVGVIRDARDAVELTVTLNAEETPDHLEEIAEAWWSAWSPEIDNQLIYSLPSGEQRTLNVKHDGDTPREEPLLDPFDVLVAYEITMRLSADDPTVYGTPVTIGPFDGRKQSLFTSVNADGDEVGPPFNMYDEEAEGRRSVRNAGTLPSWPVWIIDGPVSEYEFEVGGQRLAGGYPVPEGGRLIIDTRARQKSAHLEVGGTRTLVTDQALTSWGFAPLPPGTTSVVIAFTGTGSVRGEAATGYERLW